MSKGYNLPRAESELEVVESTFDYGAGIQSYIDDAEKNNILRPHQVGVFNDIQEFMAQSGERRGYVQFPTGTGKTVIFVELSKAILETENKEGKRPKILVVTPKVDLVHQTVGKTKKKGYGKFAPDLKVSAYFSDSTEEDRRSLQSSDVVVTTYKSMNLMTQQGQFEERTSEEVEAMVQAKLKKIIQQDGAYFGRIPGKFNTMSQQLTNAEGFLFGQDMRNKPTNKALIDLFDVIILDEVHHVMGETAGRIVESLPRHKPIIGFTATPDANQKRKVESRLPQKIHNLEVNEAIGMGLLSPIVPIGVKSSVAMAGHDIFDAEGEYLDEKISHLASSAIRNSVIVNMAKVLADEKIGTIVSSLPGDRALHSRLLAQQMRAAGIKAEAVHKDVTSVERQRIYESFETGEIDVLTYVEVLGEGWDSERAKAIINGRPTRSLIIAKQRLGRILRPGNFALSIDVIDKYDKFNPPLLTSDLLDGSDIDRGQIFGTLTPEQQEQKDRVLSELGRVAGIVPHLPADYTNFHASLSDYSPIVGGNIASTTGKSYSVAKSVVRTTKGISEEILDKLWADSGRNPDVMEGVSGYTIRRGYERKESEKLIAAIPENNPEKVLKEKDGSQWMSSEGLVVLFGNRYPKLNKVTMEKILNEVKDLLDWKPLVFQEPPHAGSSTRPFVYKAYKADDSSIEMLNNQLRDYFITMEQLENDK